MQKEASCINSRAILDYLSAHEVDYSRMIMDLDPEIDRQEDPERFLRDPDNWISSAVVTELFRRATQLLHDDQTAYKVGCYVTENTQLGFAQRILVKAFWSTKTGLRHCQKINDQWNKSKKVELVELKRNQATVRLHWDPKMESSKYICMYNQAIYTHLPRVWDGTPLILTEKCCQFDGAPYCEYHLKWPLKNRLREIISRFVTSKAVLKDIIQEIERDKGIIHQKNDELRAVNTALREKIIALKTSQEALKESEEKYRLLFENANDAIFITQEGIIAFANPKAEEMMGYSSRQSDKVPFVDFIHPEDRDRVVEGHQKRLKGEDLPNIDSFRLLARSGEALSVELNAVSIEWEGKPATLNFLRDVTAQKRLEAQLHQAQKMESLGLLAGGVAHDLNNILSGIVTYPELLLMDLTEDSPLRRPIKTMQESGIRAADIVADLLTIARGVATGKDVLNLNTIVTEYLNSPEYQGLKKTRTTVDIKTRLDRELLNMRGSSTHIKKSLMNLVINASEAIEGTGTVTISTLNRYLDAPLKGYEDVRTGEYAVLAVSDNGSGILSRDIERIFEPFYTKKIMGRSGTGLGLAVVWNTVQDHNGYINVTSNRNGTIFELYFPVTREEIADGRKAVAFEDLLGHGERILVVDDEESQREIASNILTKLGYHTHAVSSGGEAIAYVKKHPVDLIVLDMVMPKGMNGREAYEEIIKIRPGQKAVIASGYSKTKDVNAAQASGAGKYIKKPYTLEKIGVAVRRELERSR